MRRCNEVNSDEESLSVNPHSVLCDNEEDALCDMVDATNSCHGDIIIPSSDEMKEHASYDIDAITKEK